MRRPWCCSARVFVLAVLSGSVARVDAQERPYLFAVGRYTAAWAGRPWSYDQQLWDHMVNIGATMNGSGLAWVDGEPVQGQYNWDAIAYADFAVDEMRLRGLEPTFFLGLTPAWAALYPSLPPYRTPPSEDYVDEFMDFHRFVADRYKGKVKYYYFWNEPNGCSWVNDGCGNMDGYPLYTQWLIRCSQAVKEMDPGAKIIAGNLDYHAGVTTGYEYIEGMYDHGAGPYFDIISIHPYDWSGTIHWQALLDTRAVMVAHGDADKPIWISEYGWNTTDYQATADKMVQVLTELKKPEWSFVEMANYLVLNDGSGVENYGLMDANLDARAGYYAFRDFDKTWPVVVDFSGDVRAGEAPLTVQFTDLSTLAGAMAWHWEFGDGQTSDAHHPSHTYAAEGTFTVRLTVTGGEGQQATEKIGYIRAGTFPRVAFIAGQVPTTLSDSTVVGHLEERGLIVDVYDDEPANRPSASVIAAGHDLVIGSSTLLSANVAGEFRHEPVPFVFWEAALAWYANPDDRECIANGATAVGGHTHLDVIDTGHRIMQGIASGLNAVTATPEDFSFCTGTAAPGARVLATAAGTPSDKAVIVVEPGAQLLDGGTAADKRVFLFLYDDTWLGTNETGRRIFDNTLAYTLGEPTAELTASVTVGQSPLVVDYTDLSTGPVTSWSWSFGDGSGSTLRHPSHTYTTEGTYSVSLTVTGPGSDDTRVRPAYVTVLAGVPGDFDGDGDVDLADHGYLQGCLTGEGAGPPAAGCEAADLDEDADVDQSDFEIFSGCLSGPNIPGDVGCAG